MMLGVAFGGLSSILSGANMLKIGMMAASALGMYLLNGKKEKGEIARLSDLKVSSSSYGRGIPIVYGTMRVTGNMFWATDFEETLRYLHPKGKEGKKAEKKGTPYYEYHANFAMALCEGPVEEVLRIWADSNLIYDKHNPTNEDIVGPGFSREEQGGGKAGFGAAKKKGGAGGDSGRFQFRYYAGTESQMQDPFMVSKQGSSMVPAHRGLCYLFFEHFALMDFGNRVPTITAEVATKKQMGLHYRTMTNLPGAAPLTLVEGVKWVDPERYRFYVEENHPGTGRLLRIYDLSKDQEISRVYNHEVLEINLDNPVWPNNANSFTWIGIAGNGDLVIRFPNGSNSNPIGFLDPNTFVLKHRFGVGSTGLSNAANRIVRAEACVPVTYIDLQISLDGSVEATPKRATLVQSMGGWFYIFDEDHTELTYFDLPGVGFTTYVSRPIPTSAEIFGGTFYVQSAHNTGRSAQLWKVDWTIPTGMTPGGQYMKINEYSGDGAKLVRNIEVPTSQVVRISGIQLVTGTEEVVWFESYSVPDPLQAGTWALAVKAQDESLEIVYNEKISSSTFSVPNNASPINTSNKVSWLHQDDVWSVDFAARKASRYQMDNFIGVSSRWQMFWPQRGAIITWINDPTDSNERKWTMVLIDRNNQVPVDVHFIVSDLADRVGIPNSRVDLTALNPQEIIGYIIENPTGARKVIEELAQIFMFDVVESDYRLKFVSRGVDSILTIPQKDLGITDQETMDYFNETRTQEIDLPQTVVVSYINAAKDYQVNSQHYRRPRSPMAVMQSRDKLELNLPMAMNKNFAKQLAHKICMAVWTERIMFDVLLPWTYLQYDPTDVITFEMDDSLTFEIRMMKMDLGANFAIDCTGVSQTPAAYTSDAEAQDDGGVIYLPKPWPPQTKALAFNVPYLFDSDYIGQAQFLYYFGAGALTPGLRGATVEYRVPGNDWDFAGLVTEELVYGSVVQPIPAPPHGPYATDDVNVIRLIPTHRYEDESGYVYAWESIPPSLWPTTDNCIIIGEEVIYFRDVEVLPNGSVNISHLIRGARGTENAAYSHKQNETFCIVTSGLQNDKAPFGFAKQTWMFRSFSTYSIFPPFRTDVRLDAASHMPWGPNYFRRSMSGSTLRINFERRPRLGGDMLPGTGSVPVGEDSAEFEVYVLEQPYDPDFFDPENPATFKRAFTGLTAMQANYTSAMRAADGYNVADPLHVVAFQVSAQIGRGFPGYATLNATILT